MTIIPLFVKQMVIGAAVGLLTGKLGKGIDQQDFT